jgi:hypothetical protein
MKTHELLDAANLDPAAWILEAGVYLAQSCGEDKADYLAAAFDDIAAESRDPKGACFSPEHTREGVRQHLGDSLIDSRFAAKGTCDHCGAWFKFGMIYRHTSGVACVVGHTCAAQSFAVENRYTLTLNRARKAAQAREHSAKMAAAARAQAVGGGFEWLYAEKHTNKLLADVASKGAQYGSLSERQIELVKRVRDDVAKRAAEPQLPPSTYQGEVGKPLTVTVEILAVREREGYMPGTKSFWHLMRDAAGNVYTSRGASIGDRGEKIAGTFTVKAHEEYQGTKQTILQRPRKLSTVTA